MKCLLATVAARKPASGTPVASLLEVYLARAAKYLPCEHQVFSAEDKLLTLVEKAKPRAALFLADSGGELLTSPQFAAVLTRALDNGAQLVVLAIGPADGWSATARSRADLLLSFGRITLPHELAAVVAAEQLYRALTIRAGHPYHTGH